MKLYNFSGVPLDADGASGQEIASGVVDLE